MQIKPPVLKRFGGRIASSQSYFPIAAPIRASKRRPDQGQLSYRTDLFERMGVQHIDDLGLFLHLRSLPPHLAMRQLFT